MRARACYAAAAAALGLLAPAEGLVLNGMSGLQLPRTRHSAPCHVSHRRGVAMTAAGTEITTEVKPWMSEGGARAVTNAEWPWLLCGDPFVTMANRGPRYSCWPSSKTNSGSAIRAIGGVHAVPVDWLPAGTKRKASGE
eukprot:Tamp_36151.p1 GENE.Tamp_36151~~Tamp_36151.p1  ORF type:complete len:139 (-),score=9.55 Tamp_36151:143-559(-)